MYAKLVVGGRFSGPFSLDFRFVNVVISDLVCDCMTARLCVCVCLILSISLCEHVMGWWEGRERSLSLEVMDAVHSSGPGLPGDLSLLESVFKVKPSHGPRAEGAPGPAGLRVLIPQAEPRVCAHAALGGLVSRRWLTASTPAAGRAFSPRGLPVCGCRRICHQSRVEPAP